MKRKIQSLYYIIFLTILQVCLCFGGGLQANAAGVNDFYFDSFVGNYYLSKDEEGISHLKVVESVVAVFPDFEQNKGICRQIPFTNQGGMNITLPGLSRDNITVTRNGEPEPIYSIEREGNYYNVCTGTEEYVLGQQAYSFEYEFERVVTDFKDYQELYWDTNGNGSSQKFNKVIARVHFDEDVRASYAGKNWCYVGRYGESGQERCKTQTLPDGVEFIAKDLKAYENLTFDIELRPGSFNVPAPQPNLALVWMMVGCGVILILTLYFPIRRYVKAAGKREFYKRHFVKPEYQPHKDYSVAEMAEIYLGKKHDAKVAVLLDLIVRKKVELKKEGKSKRKGWRVLVKSLDGVSDEGKIILQILNNGEEVARGDEVEIKSRTATSKLVSLGRKYDSKLVSALKTHGLVESKYQVGSSGGLTGFSGLMATVMIFLVPVFGGVLMLYGEMEESGVLIGNVVGQEAFLPVIFVEVMVAITVWSVLWRNSSKYLVRTEKGLEAARYMDGLKLYIGMAEAERMKFLQSVKGADTSDTGVVRLYEKLLPYAAVLGLEKSWMAELEKYYKLNDVMEPDWYRDGITVRDIYYMSTIATGVVRTSTTMVSSGGGSSSGFSGGGGGGFSGGGGGGGGFGGR